MASEINRRIVSAISLFTSMQAVQIVCSVLRIKIITLWLGQAGVALFGIYQTVLELISTITQLGIRTSAVKEIAAHPQSGIVVSVRRFGLWLGILGAVVSVALCVPLSRFSFGTSAAWWQFCLLGVALFVQSLTGAEQAVSQGLGYLKSLARAGLIGAVAGLALSIPLYRLMGLYSVVPSLIVYALGLWIPLRLMRPHTENVPVEVSRTLRQGAGFVKVGAYITLAAILAYAVNYLMLVYIRKSQDSLNAVAHYQAGYTMLWRYVGMIYVSVSYEFYPRLSRISHSPIRISAMVNHQSLFVLLLMLPCAAAAIAASPLLLRLLYNEEFLPAIPYFVIGMAAMMLRPASLSISYTFLATGRGRTYCVSEISSSLINLAFNVVGYHFGGLFGLGVALVAWMIVDLGIMMAFYGRAGMKLRPQVVALTAIFTAVVFVCAMAELGGYWWISAAVAVVSLPPVLRFLRR